MVPLLVALVFGAIIAATDPISVLAIFRDIAVSKRLSTIVEAAGELQLARSRLIAAQKRAIEEALHQGLLSDATAAAMLDEADRELDQLLAADSTEMPRKESPAQR